MSNSAYPVALYVHYICCMYGHPYRVDSNTWAQTPASQVAKPPFQVQRLRKISWANSVVFVGCFLPDLQILTAASVNLNRPDVVQTLQRDISKCPVANLGPNICWSAWPLSTESKVDEALYRCDAMQWCEIFSLSNSEIMHLFQHLETWWLFNFSAPFRCSSDWHL